MKSLIWLFCLIAYFALASSDDQVVGDGTPKSEQKTVLSIEELTKLPGKQLRTMLDKKGVVCKGCSEKIDFVQRVFETQELPDKEIPPPPVEEGKGLSQDKINELMDDLKRRGFTKDGKIVSGSDFSNMSPEEMIAAMNRKPPPLKKNSKKSKEKAKIIDEYEANEDFDAEFAAANEARKSKEKEKKKQKTNDDKKKDDKKKEPASPKKETESKPEPKGETIEL